MHVRECAPGFHLGAPTTRKIVTKQFGVKDTVKSSSRKLRHVIHYNVYRLDPQKNALETTYFTQKCKEKQQLEQSVYIPP